MTATPRFDHLVAITDRFGTFEHADHALARREHGYCADDVARVLVVTTNEPRPSEAVRSLAQGSLAFLTESLDARGACRNRRGVDGSWTDEGSFEDCWGRSVWGLGAAAASGQFSVAGPALSLFERVARNRSPWLRTTAFAVLGAVAVASVDPENPVAQSLLLDGAQTLSDLSDGEQWPWPEPRLAYANAVVPEAMIAAGTATDHPALVRRGLQLLEWLLARETREGHLSTTPAQGAGPDDTAPAFDQQPIEVAAMANACARAHSLNGAAKWLDGIRMANDWFDGDNDAGVMMWDPLTGGGFDGLLVDVANVNQGAESTLALIATRQQAIAHQLVVS